MSYVDDYVLPLPKENVAAYEKLAQKAAKVWKDLQGTPPFDYKKMLHGGFQVLVKR